MPMPSVVIVDSCHHRRYVYIYIYTCSDVHESPKALIAHGGLPLNMDWLVDQEVGSSENIGHLRAPGFCVSVSLPV